MRVGIVILPDQPWSEARHRWQRAEAYGFDHAWTYDHLGWRDLIDGLWFDAVPTLTAAAMVTTTLRLGTLVASPNFRHPAHFAREVTALDDISGGRLTVGLGAGGTGSDADVIGTPTLAPAARMDRFTEFVDLLDTVLTDQRATYRGDYFTAVDARSIPGSVQQPRVPFLIAANGPRAMRLAARHGQGWVTSGGPATDMSAWWQTVAGLAHRFDDVLAAGARDPSSIQRHLSLDAGPVFSLSSVDAFTDAVGRAAELGFTDVVTHWPRADSWYAGSESVLEQVASEVLPKLARQRT